MINKSLINVHDVLLISAIAIAAHFILLPLYNKVANKDEA